MRLAAIILGLGLASTALSQTPRELAVEDAVARLEAQVRQQTLEDGTTLGELIDRLDARESLIQTLRRAEQIGGLRRLGADHVQVQYRIDGRCVRQALVDANQELDADLLSRALDELQFVAIGSSLPARPTPTPRERLEARVVEAIRSAPTLAEVTIDEPSMQAWLARTPVMTDHDGAVTRHTLSPDYADLLGPLVPAAQVETVLTRMRFELPTTFSLVIESPGADAPTPAAATLTIPDWVGTFIRASGSAPAGATPLLTARASEDQARRQLRLAIDALSVKGQIVGALLHDDQGRRDALDRLVQSARVMSTEYQNDGSAVSTISLDGRRVWDVVAP